MNAAHASRRTSRAARSFAPLCSPIDSIVDTLLGADEAARRIRRYMSDHDAPSDERSAYERLCIVIFAQGLGYETVAAKLTDLSAAFAGFDPQAVARFDDARVADLLREPIIRNEAKIRACIENAKRWVALAAPPGSFLGRVAEAAAKDDAASGWPALAKMLSEDFVRIGDLAARQTLKRWGFFTAAAHPGARRALERLGFADAAADGPFVQRVIGAAAHKLSRDPYSIEAALALFAGIGPCRKSPRCAQCGLADRCPSAQV